MAKVAIQGLPASLAAYLNRTPSKTEIIEFFRGQELDLLPLTPFISPHLHNQIATSSGATANLAGYTACEKCTRRHLDRGRSDCTWCAKISWYRIAVYSVAIFVATLCAGWIIDLVLAVDRHETAGVAPSSGETAIPPLIAVSRCITTTSNGKVALGWSTWSASLKPQPT